MDTLKNNYICLFLIVFSLITVSIINPIIIANDASTESDTSSIDKQTYGIYNSEGYYSSSLTSSSIQAAIDHLQSNSGTVWVQGEIELTTTIHPRSYVTVNFLGNSIQVAANVPVVSYAQNTLFSIIKNAVVYLPSFYDNTVFLFDNNGMDGSNDAIDFNNIENIIIHSEKSFEYTGIQMRLDGINEMWNNVFKNIIMHGPKTAILLEMTANARSSVTGSVGFSNGNAFDNILIDSFEYGIRFIKPSWYTYGGFNCNYFSNIELRFCEQTKQGITGVFGSGNTFMGISMDDWQDALDLSYLYQIYTNNIKLYVDQWIYDHFLFNAPNNLNVLETSCPASFSEFYCNDSFYKFNFSNRGVHSSDGHFYEQASSASIRDAINALPNYGGSIYINEPSVFTSPIYLKSNVELDFLGYDITLSSLSDGFIFGNGVRSATLKNTLIRGVGDKNQDFILFKLTGSTFDDIIQDNYIDHVTMEGNGYTGIHLVIDGVSGIWNNTFSDIHLYKSNGICLEMTSQGFGSGKFGWANGNRFEYVCNDEFYKGVEFLIPSIISTDEKAGFNYNLFKHILYQIEPNSQYGMINISGNSNTFMHVIFWDDLYGTMNSFVYITDRAVNTKMWADWDKDQCYDNGFNSLIEQGIPLFETSGWEIENDINQSVFDRGFPIRHAYDGDWGAAQSFIPNSDSLTSCDIYLRKFGTPEFNFTVELHHYSVDGPLVDTVEFLPDKISSNWHWLKLDYKNIIVDNTKYFIVVPPAPSGVTTSFGYEWGYAFDNQYWLGSFLFTCDSGNLWHDLPTMYEFVFKTYGYS